MGAKEWLEKVTKKVSKGDGHGKLLIFQVNDSGAIRAGLARSQDGGRWVFLGGTDDHLTTTIEQKKMLTEGWGVSPGEAVDQLLEWAEESPNAKIFTDEDGNRYRCELITEED